MGATYTIDTDKKLISLEMEGVFTFDNARGLYETLFTDPAYDPSFTTISDFSNIKHLDLPMSEAANFRAMAKKFDTKEGKVAMVMGENFGRLMWGKMAALQFKFVKSNPYQAFRTREEALQWLAVG